MPFAESTEPSDAEIRTDEFVVRRILASDAEHDHAAVMDTRDALRLWRQSTWPEDDFTADDNRIDVVDLEERHTADRAYTYTVVDPGGERCIGCVYVFPTDATFLARSTVVAHGVRSWSDVDAVVFLWVRRGEMEAGLDERLLTALRAWFADAWPFETVVYATSEEFAQQLRLLSGAGLSLQFAVSEPGVEGRRLVFG